MPICSSSARLVTVQDSKGSKGKTSVISPVPTKRRPTREGGRRAGDAISGGVHVYYTMIVETCKMERKLSMPQLEIRHRRHLHRLPPARPRLVLPARSTEQQRQEPGLWPGRIPCRHVGCVPCPPSRGRGNLHPRRSRRHPGRRARDPLGARRCDLHSARLDASNSRGRA